MRPYIRDGHIAQRRNKTAAQYDLILAVDDKIEQLKMLVRFFPRNFASILKSKRFEELNVWFNSVCPLSEKYKTSTRVFWVVNNISDWTDDRVICPICKTPLKHRDVYTVELGYGDQYCSTKCMNMSTKHIQHVKKTMLDRTGYESPFENPDVYKHMQNICIDKLGVDNPSKSKQFMSEKSDRYFENHGVRHNFQDPECITNRERTWIEKYGVKNPNQSQTVKDKIKKTNNERYGCDCIFQSDQFAKHSRKTYRYDGFTFASGSELIYYIWLKDNCIQFEFQPKMKKLRYEFEGKIHTYTPDFWLIAEDRLIDVKGDHFLEDGKLINPFDRTLDGLYAAKQKCMIENHVELILT